MGRLVVRLRAPEFRGRGWLNTGDQSLTLAALRGKVVLLDFWTSCCVNCLHVLSELRPIEEQYSDSLVVVGVHSPKFEHEKDPAALAAAIGRYSVEHPVLDDPDLVTWQLYAVRAWPTLVVIDPEGYIAAQMSGEGHGHTVERLVEELVTSHEARGTLHRGGGPFVPPPTAPTTLQYPAKTIALASGNLLVADAGHHSLAELSRDGDRLVRRIGTGTRGSTNGPAAVAEFNEPNGLCVLPSDIANQVGYDVVVADTANHLLRGVRLSDGRVRTLAGTGQQWMQGDPLPSSSFADSPLSSPWDVVWLHEWAQVAIAMAGNHQLWSFDPLSSRLSVRAGTTNEGLVDGELATAWFAQPSGLAASTDGSTLWLVDAETSSLRRVRNGVVHTEVGSGLFDFGLVDGPASEALLQHPLGVTVLPDDSVALADTYNGAVRRWDPVSKSMSTLATGLAEPSGIAAVADHLLVTESSGHRLTRIRIPDAALHVDPTRGHTLRPALGVVPGAFDIEVDFVPPPDQKLDERYGPATHLVVSSSPPGLVTEGAGSGTDLRRQVVLADDVTEGVLHVSARAASCDTEGAEFPACHVHQQDWGVPVVVESGGTRTLTLVLSDTSAATR